MLLTARLRLCAHCDTQFEDDIWMSFLAGPGRGKLQQGDKVE